MAQLEAGKCPDRESFLREYPDIADGLAGQLEALEFLHFTAPQLAYSKEATAYRELSSQAMLGDFRLIKQIGRGGMGIVYEAEQLSLRRRVAVKILPFASMLDPRRLKRFQNEARAAAMLEHAHIVPVYFVGQERGIHFYAMQLIEGQSLAQVIQEMGSASALGGNAKASSPAMAVKLHNAKSQDTSADNSNTAADSTDSRPSDRGFLLHPSRGGTSAYRREFYGTIAVLGAQAAEALQHAHDHGIIHRDIKPGNLLVDSSGKLWVTDFGLARLEAHESMTVEDDVLGTLAYMSPEQLSAEASIDFRSDIYSLGATLYELITRQRPFFRRGDLKKPATLIHADIPPASRYDPDIPLDLQTIVLKAMSQEPADRYLTAQAMANDLRSYAAGTSIRARPPSYTERLVRWSRKHPRISVAGGLLGLALLMVLGLSTLVVSRANVSARNALALSHQHSERVEQLLYLSDMERAFQAWQTQRIDQVRSALQQHLPHAGQTDRRRVEWHLLNALTQPVPSTIVGSHEGSANQLAVFPDGKRVASVGDDQQLRIWDIESGDALATIDVSDSSVDALNSVAISPDGKSVVIGSMWVQVWNADTGLLSRRLTSFDHNVQSIAISQDGERIAAASRYDRIRILSLSGDLLAEIEEGSRHESLVFTHQGERLLVPCRVGNSGRIRGIVREWNSDLTQVHREFHVDDQDMSTNYTLAASSPDGTFYALSSRYGPASTCLVDAVTGEVLLRLPTQRDEINATVISPDGKMLAAGFNDGRIEYWQLDRLRSGQFVTPERTRTLQAHEGKVNSLGFYSPNQLLSCGADGTVKAWQLGGDNNPVRIGSSSGLGPAPSLTGTPYAYAEQVGIQFVTAAEEGLAETIHLTNCSLGDFSFSQDGRLMSASWREGSIHIYSRTPNAVRQELVVGGPTLSVCFSPTTNELAAITSNGTMTLWDLKSMSKIKEKPLSSQASGQHACCCYSPDGRFLLGAGSFREIVVMEASSLSLVRRISVNGKVSQMIFNPNGELLATSHNDGVIRIWDWPDCRKRCELVGHEAGVGEMVFSPDGCTLASNSVDKTTRLWAPAEGRSFGVLYRHSTPPIGLDFSLDGKFLYVGRERSDDYTPDVLVFASHVTSVK